MPDNIDFKKLWSQQPASPLDTNDLILKVSHIKKMYLRKLIVTNILFCVTSAFIIFIWIFYQPQFLTTKIGIMLVIAAMVIYLFAINRSAPLLKKTGAVQSNKAYLNNLLSVKAKQKFLQTTMLNLYFVMLSSGIGLYMFEYTSRMKPIWAIIAYGITLAWILFNWFYLRPKQIKKQRAGLDEVISKFEILEKQLDG